MKGTGTTKKRLRKVVALGVASATLTLIGSPVLAQPAHAISPERVYGRSCGHDGKSYRPGSMVKINGEWHYCHRDGAWRKNPPIIIMFEASSGYGY
jgi:hypothetical protein